MDTLVFLIALQLLSVPFLQEAEQRGRSLQRFPALGDIARLGRVRRVAWFRPYCAFAVLFAGIVFSQAAPDDEIETLVCALLASATQAILWIAVACSIRKNARRQQAPVPRKIAA